jgi:hypothetical protein
MGKWALGLVLVGLVGCGGMQGPYSCDQTVSGVHSCHETTTDAPNFSPPAFQDDCTMSGGTAGTGCPHAGAVGACATTQSGNGVSITQTNWFYSGTAADHMGTCIGAGTKWINP